MNKTKKNNQKKIIIIITICLFLIIFNFLFKTEEVEITGTDLYSKEQFEQIIKFDNKNSIVNFVYYNYFYNKKIPFVEDIKISLKSPTSIEVKIKEKQILGYIEYMGFNLYFNNDGILVENSIVNLKKVPKINNMQIDNVILNSKIEENTGDIFNDLVLIMQTVKKYELYPDEISLNNKNSEIILDFDSISVNLGNGDSMDDKMARVKDILPRLKNESGVLHMERYTNNSTNISFIKNLTEGDPFT